MARNNDPRYRKVFEDVHMRIRSGSILPGMKIDSEQTLASQWNCSRHTVRRALLELAGRGLLQQRPGRGWFVSNKQQHQHEQRIICMGWTPTQALSELCLDHGYTLNSQHKPAPNQEELLVDIYNDEQIAGVIAVEMRQPSISFIQSLQERQKHVVLVGLAEACICDVVSLDFFNASLQLVSMAYQQGHRHIAFCGRHLHKEIAPFKRRVEGYLHACQLNNIQEHTWILPRNIYNADEVSRWNQQQLQKHPEVSCCILDSHATAQCIAALHEVKNIPNELVLAGYGNGRLSYGQHLPVNSFDAIYEAWDEIHHVAVHRMLARLNGDQTRPSHTLLPCDFIPGETGLFT